MAKRMRLYINYANYTAHAYSLAVLIAITHTVPVGLQIFPLDGLVLENLRIRRHI